MIDQETVDRLGRHWDEGWNGADVDVIMAPFAESVVFSARTGDRARRPAASGVHVVRLAPPETTSARRPMPPGAHRVSGVLVGRQPPVVVVLSPPPVSPLPLSSPTRT